MLVVNEDRTLDYVTSPGPEGIELAFTPGGVLPQQWWLLSLVTRRHLPLPLLRLSLRALPVPRVPANPPPPVRSLLSPHAQQHRAPVPERLSSHQRAAQPPSPGAVLLPPRVRRLRLGERHFPLLLRLLLTLSGNQPHLFNRHHSHSSPRSRSLVSSFAGCFLHPPSLSLALPRRSSRSLRDQSPLLRRPNLRSGRSRSTPSPSRTSWRWSVWRTRTSRRGR